jgi:KipI family sensor histidine kinase inhibitor
MELLRIDNFGPDALLVRYAAQGDALAFARGRALLRHVTTHPPTGLAEVTPGFTTLLLEFGSGARPDPKSLEKVFEAVVGGAKEEPGPERTVDVPVVYDGPDLGRVAETAGMTVEQVIELHVAGEYRVHLLGFSPGFAYLGGLDRRLHTPRLGTPRLKVPAGAVAIGGEHTGIYPVATAGGWNLVGRTDLALLDPARAAMGSPEAFGLLPGDGVRFIRVKQLRSEAQSPSQEGGHHG